MQTPTRLRKIQEMRGSPGCLYTTLQKRTLVCWTKVDVSCCIVPGLHHLSKPAAHLLSRWTVVHLRSSLQIYSNITTTRKLCVSHCTLGRSFVGSTYLANQPYRCARRVPLTSPGRRRSPSCWIPLSTAPTG